MVLRRPEVTPVTRKISALTSPCSHGQGCSSSRMWAPRTDSAIVLAMANRDLRDEDLDEIERRADAATPGPWFVRILSDEYSTAITAVTTKPGRLDDPPAHFDPSEVVAITYLQQPEYATLDVGESDSNASFIAHARIDVLRLVEEVRRLKASS